MTNRLAIHEQHWRRFGVHRASEQALLPVVATGWPALDRLLPSGGYPLGAVTELLTADTGSGELSLLLPCLAACLETRPQSQIALVSPPHRLNAPALVEAGLETARVPIIRCRDNSERLWAMEQMACPGAFQAFVVWGDTLDDRSLRRLQLAAEHAACPVFVYRGLARAGQRSPAALRLVITGRDGRQQLEICKCRGPAGARLSGLEFTRDNGWQMPEVVQSEPVSRTACSNDSNHVAGTTVPPLGAR